MDGAGNVLYNCRQVPLPTSYSSFTTPPYSSYETTLEQIRETPQSRIQRYTIHLHWNGSVQMSMTNPSRERKRILFVDDYEDEWGIVAFKLEEHQLSFARNFDEGLRLARQWYFDLYILDNWLPDGSGVGLCRLIRKFDQRTPILFYSAAAYERDIEEALRSGAQAYLVKPVVPDDLEREVARLTSPRRWKGF
jgi:CheY-like chemotaxis protein